MAWTSRMVPKKEGVASLSCLSKGKPKIPPTIKQCKPNHFDTVSDFAIENTPSTPSRCEPVSRYISMITNTHRVKKNYRWGAIVQVEIPKPYDSIVDYNAGFLSIYTYPFTLGPIDPSSPKHSDTRSSISFFLRIVYMLWYLSNQVKWMTFTLDQPVRLYSSLFY